MAVVAHSTVIQARRELGCPSLCPAYVCALSLPLQGRVCECVCVYARVLRVCELTSYEYMEEKLPHVPLCSQDGHKLLPSPRRTFKSPQNAAHGRGLLAAEADI